MPEVTLGNKVLLQRLAPNLTQSEMDKSNSWLHLIHRAQLTEHKTEDQRRTYWWRLESCEFLQNFCLNFHKINRCHYLLEAVVSIPLYLMKNVFYQLSIGTKSQLGRLLCVLYYQTIGRSDDCP